MQGSVVFRMENDLCIQYQCACDIAPGTRVYICCLQKTQGELVHGLAIQLAPSERS